ncbi:unnamed protein product [Rhizoctonia solani]|uniref:Major facilitator superfamily (MFS) profile domain-containing protein n=1 Tax=Rhizoctonia solani TaxID=456999 RepID=A0A8H3BX81_9AGAM|nr:unnamed protein product [Rhizoctonia solani]
MKPDNPPRPEVEHDSEQCTSIDEAESGRHQQVAVRKRTPLPMKQVLVLCLMSFSEPVSIFVIFPFVNQMIEELGVTSDPKELGYYSGFVEGIFSVTQFLTIYFWGSLSDRIGRRPVLILGLCGVVGSTIMFGLSQSFTMMLLSRALSGALNGNSPVIKSALAEITDETNQGAAFAYLPLCWSLGSLLAPALGGFLSHPAEHHPSVFGFELFRRYPYLLPCLAGAAFSTIGLIAGVLFLEESLPKNRFPTATSGERQPLLDSTQSQSQSSSTPTTGPVPTPRLPAQDASDCTGKHVTSAKEIIRIPYIRKILVSYGFMAYVSMALNALLVLWLYTPVKAGGIGFTVAEIGTVLTLSGIFGTAIAAVVFPPLERRVGALHLYRFTMIVLALNVLIFPLGHVLTIVGGKMGAYLGVAIMLIMRCIAGMVFVCNILLVTRSAPCKHSRGTVNGLAQMVASASRAVGPAMATSLFAFSVKSNILGGNLVWLVFSLVALMGVMSAYQIPDGHP